ncbi:MAG TPA: Calx-beta domain-containing protein, partial [Phycisphaerae bacterium]|nr:Calx-beta domain-containing protein [Phycisphaerae bacterium]
MRANCWLMALALTAAVAMPARAGQTTPGSGMIFVADSKDAVGNNPDFDTEYPYPHVSTRAGDAMLGVGYGVVNWNAGYCTAGQQARLAKWNDPNDDYEKLGTWEGGGSWTDITYAGRGLVRYDEDTYLVLCTQSNPENTNAASVPAVLQVEYYDDWFTSPPYTDDQYLDSVNYDSVYLLRAAPRPDAAQWGPQPQDTFLTPPGPCDWSWTGCGTVGKLQFADTATIGPSYAWDDDPNANPMYDYITFCSLGQNFQSVDNAWGPFRHDGDLYKDSRDVSGRASEDFADSSALELVAFYGETENVLYMTQYAGRIYKMVGAKNLGWRRRAGQAAPDTRLGDGTNITQTPNYFFPLYVGGSLYAADTSGGGPVIGDAILADPNDPNGPYVGTAMTSVELFNAALPYDPNDPNTLDPVVTDRHYTGLAVDCGGRVYAVSERIVNGNGDEPAAKFRGVQADVWNYAPGEYGLYRIEKASNLFGDPNTTPVAVGDTLVLTEGSVDPSFLNVEFTIEAIDPGGVFAKLDGDCGDSEGAFNVSYTVYSPGASPIPDPNTNPFTSQALIDVYLPDGTLDTIIDLNTLVRPDGVSLGDYRYDGGNIHGVIIHGDVEIDPGLVYDPNDPNWPLDPLGEDVTRLWIYCAGGDEDPSTDDGLDLVVVDVSIAANGTVAGASFVGGIDDGDIDIGMFHQGDYTRGFNPWDKWIAFSELEFDGASNLVAIGGRGMDGNRYAGVTAASVKEAVARMLGEAAGDPNDPNNDAIVGINGFNMDMDIYGFKTAYGFAFADSPLWNNGSKTVPPPTVEFDAVSSSGDESVTPVNLSVSLSAASDQTVTVDYAVTGGTAVDPNDYAIAAGPLTFDPGVTQQDIVITVVDDGLVESDETIEVTLSDPSNAILGTNTVHTYTINDNDVYPTVAFDLVSSSGDESVTPVNLSVSLSAAYVETVTVDYAV